jgi:hypothetical protein
MDIVYTDSKFRNAFSELFFPSIRKILGGAGGGDKKEMRGKEKIPFGYK